MTERQFSRQQLASKVGLSVRTVEGWFSQDPKKKPSKTAMKLIAQL